ncbi:MAG: N-acetylmuramoyl-L-alanine amidase [Clostridia bacterium]|nr:N-acetylmuramoyl-L-alanine amidase [Clostridia bacterium]
MSIVIKHRIFLIFMLLALSCLFWSCISSSTYAASETVEVILSKKISIIFNNELKSFSDVNGKTVYPLLYEGTTYLPIRALSNLFENAVTWDAENNRVLLGKGEMDTSTVKTVSVFVTGENETVSALLNKEIQIEYKEKPQTFTNVNGVQVYPLSYEGTTYLPVRAISNMYGAEIDWDGATSRITIRRENKLANITNVTIKVIDGTPCAVVNTDNPVYDYKYYSLEDPNRLILDLKNTNFSIDKTSQQINYGTIESVRFGDQGNNLNRIVLDVSKIGTYTVVQSDDRRLTYLALSENFELKDEEKNTDILVASIGDKIFIPADVKTNSGETNSGEDTNNDTNTNTNTENTTSGETVIVSSGDENQTSSGEKTEEQKETEDNELTEAEIAKLAKVTSVKYAASTNKTRISISGSYQYEKFILQDPPRIVIDIKKAYLAVDGPTEITPINKNIKEIRFSQNEKDKVRVVIELEKSVDYEISKSSSYIDISVEEPSYRNISYESSKDSATLTFYDVKKKVFDTSEVEKSNKYTISYSSSKFDSGKGIIEPDDDFVKSIEIKTNKITINVTEKMTYEMSQEGDDVVLTMTKKTTSSSNTTKQSEDDFVVLIDAGHGGSDPGAINGTDYEKIYNLSIASKIYDLLEDTDGITAYMSRESDTYMDRQDRVDFIMKYTGKADLFVSIHNNSTTNKNYSGTMVLYYNKECEKDFGITSKEFASIVLEELTSSLKTKNLGVVSREDLWVLSKSNLPSILCEIAFVSNDAELARLKTEEFQNNAAQAVYEGILAAKKQMGR